MAFISKTQLIDHYIESLGAIHVGGQTSLTKEEEKALSEYIKKNKLKKTKKSSPKTKTVKQLI